MKLELPEPSIQTEPTATPSNNTQQNIHDLPLQVPTLTNSPRCAPAAPTRRAAPRRVRKVRVDAWSVPAPANWSRTRSSVRKVNRSSHATDWALPF